MGYEILIKRQKHTKNVNFSIEVHTKLYYIFDKMKDFGAYLCKISPDQ